MRWNKLSKFSWCCKYHLKDWTNLVLKELVGLYIESIVETHFIKKANKTLDFLLPLKTSEVLNFTFMEEENTKEKISKTNNAVNCLSIYLNSQN